jgi:hypothetical protein
VPAYIRPDGIERARQMRFHRKGRNIQALTHFLIRKMLFFRHPVHLLLLMGQLRYGPVQQLLILGFPYFIIRIIFT